MYHPKLGAALESAVLQLERTDPCNTQMPEKKKKQIQQQNLQTQGEQFQTQESIAERAFKASESLAGRGFQAEETDVQRS